MEQVLPGVRELGPGLRANFLLCLAFIVFEAGDFELAGGLLNEAKDLFEQTRQLSGLAWTMALLGPIEVAFGRDRRDALACLERADALARDSGDEWTTFYVLTIHANVKALGGETASAMALMKEALAMARRFGNPLLIAHASVELGILALLQGERDVADERLAEGALLLRDLHHREGLSYLLDGRGIEAALAGDWEKAATAFGASEGVREAINLEMWPPLRGIRQPFIHRVRDELDAEVLAQRTDAGRAFTTEEAINFCIGQTQGER